MTYRATPDSLWRLISETVRLSEREKEGATERERRRGERKQEKRPCALGDRALKHLAEADSCSLAAKPTSAAALDCTGPAWPGK